MKIGTFQKINNGFIEGEIITLGLSINVILKPNESTNHNAPSFIAQINNPKGYEIGAAWEKETKNNKPYLQLSLDCPTYPNTIYITLFQSDDNENKYIAFWERKKS